jgi:hypothetical protein
LASATEYREITLSDGRVLIAQVLESEGTTMWVRTPLGRIGVDVLTISSIESVTRADYEHQTPLTVLLLPVDPQTEDLETVAETTRELLYSHLNLMNGLEVIGSEALSAHLGEEIAQTLEDCGPDLGCSLAYVAPTGIDMVIRAEVVAAADSLEYHLQAAMAVDPNNAAEQVFQHHGSAGIADLIGQHLLRLLGVDESEQEFTVEDPPQKDLNPQEPEPAPEEMATRLEGSGPLAQPGQRLLSRTALVPVPGLPSLLRRDLRSFGLSWGVVIPTTVGMVALVGQSTFRPTQFNILSLLSYYALTVGVNRRFGLEGAETE